MFFCYLFRMIKLNKFFRNNLYLLVLSLFVLCTALVLNFYTINKKNQEKKIVNLFENTYLKKSSKLLLKNLKPKFSHESFKIDKGDTLEKIIKKLNIPLNEKKLITNSLLKHNFVSKLYEGQVITFKLDNTIPIKVTKITFEISKTKNIIFNRAINLEKFTYKEIEKNLKGVVVYKEGEILNSLYSSAVESGIQPNIIIEFARLYGFQVDFQRDIWKNDSYQIVYETFEDSNDQILETGNILFANLNLQGKNHNLYIYKTKDGFEHFDDYGKSIRKSLMKTPINGARLSSSFGMRKHPILGYNKLHQGTDFAAPEGTPIMASGDGKVIRARWCGGGGNCIKIKHNSTYSTVYAHLKNFARGVKEGVRVRQGQIIGYVGSTGMSTGPHLHYEVIINGKKVNSQKLKLPSGKILKGKERELFEIKKIKLNVLKSKLISSQM